MHRNPQYFPNPGDFDPDRWTKEFKSVLHRLSYFPFGGGIRGDVGEPFAWIEGILEIATIHQKWKMHHDPKHNVEPKIWHANEVGEKKVDLEDSIGFRPLKQKRAYLSAKEANTASF
jgi:cytochrome P450